MKRTLLLTLSLLLALSLLIAGVSFAVLAEDEDYGSDGEVPDDAFDGGFVEYKGSDGSVTTVYDNGSVTTTYADGSKEGVDYKGNQHARDKEGNYTVRTTDGCTATEYKDGRQSLTDPEEGKTTTIYKDGHIREEFGELGFYVDYNKDYERTELGFIGGKETLGYDEDGNLKNGTISGPDGASLTVTDDGAKMNTPNGKKAEVAYKDGKESINIDYPDGTTAAQETTTRYEQLPDGTTSRVEDIYTWFTSPDGSRFDGNAVIHYDENGKPTGMTSVGEWENADGSTLWVDIGSRAMEYRDPTSGETFIVDKNGHVTEMTGGELDWHVNYDDNGNVTSADVTYPDGAHLVQNPDGSGFFSLPDGTEYSTDGAGNVWKDGLQIKQDGQWLYDPATLGPDADKLTESDLIGTWYVNATATDIESPLVGALQSMFEELLGEGAGAAVSSADLGDTNVSFTASIEDNGGNLRVTLYIEDVTMIYTGSLKGDTLKLKLESIHSSEDDDAMQIPVNKLELKFEKQRGVAVMRGSYRIDVAIVKMTLNYHGTKQ